MIEPRLHIPVFRNLFLDPKNRSCQDSWGFLFFLYFPEDFFTGTWFWRGTQEFLFFSVFTGIFLQEFLWDRNSCIYPGQADRGFARSWLREWNNLVQYVLLLYLGVRNKKRGGAIHGLRINREILILRKPPIEVVLLYFTWAYTNPHTRELNRYRPDDDDDDGRRRHTLNPFYLMTSR